MTIYQILSKKHLMHMEDINCQKKRICNNEYRIPLPPIRKSGRESCTSRTLLYQLSALRVIHLYLFPFANCDHATLSKYKKPFLNGFLLHHLFMRGNSRQAHYKTYLYHNPVFITTSYMQYHLSINRPMRH